MSISLELSWAEFQVPDHAVGTNPPLDPAGPPDECKPCACDCGCGQAPAKPTPPLFKPKPVRYASGEVAIEADDVSAVGFGVPWGHTRVFMNRLSATTDVGNGNNWQVKEWPYLVFPAAGTVAVMGRGLETLWFDLTGSSYVPRFTVKHTLQLDAGTNTLRLVGLDGSVTEFDATSGAFKRRLDPSGSATAVVGYTANGFNFTEVQRSAVVGSDTVTESFLYGYDDATAPFPHLTSVTLRRKVNTGAWANVDQAAYTYYGTGSSFGAPGDLAKAITRRWTGAAWADTGTTLYRYYTSGPQQSLLKYAVLPVNYARLAAAVADPVAATDAQVAGYADHYFVYDAAGRVTDEAVDGGGTASSLAVTTSANPDGYNSWKTRTVETRPDGTAVTVYANYAGQTMLHVTAADGLEWCEFYRYDASGNVDLHARPSAVAGYDETDADLLGLTAGNYSYLRDDEGLVHAYAYHAASGFLASESVQRGELGDPIPVRSYAYTARSLTGMPDTYFLASETAYPDAAAPLTTIVTGYAYTWFAGTARVQQKVTTLPVVSVAQNGSGVAATRTEVFDEHGRLVWAKDEAGFLSRTRYDTATGAAVEVIADMDTALVTDEPAGWATPAGGGLHLVTAFEVDAWGRTTKTTHPNGRVDYAVYDDAGKAVRAYPGWDANAPTGPTVVSRDDWAGGYAETLTMSAPPAVSGGRPTGAEAISGIQSLSRSFTDVGGHVTQSDAYFDLTGLTYTTGAALGLEGTNYDRTRYASDDMDRPVRTLSPAGTVSRTVYDGVGRVASEWVGTDDAPTAGEWSPANTAGANLVMVRSYEYDGGGVGDGNRTATTEYPGLGAADRVTEAYYDWRDRPVAVKAGVETTEATDVHRPIVYTEHDNLGRAVGAERYDGDGVTVTTTDGVPDRPAAAKLRALSATGYDDRGRAFRTSVHAVDPATGAVSVAALVSETWYDERGQVVKATSPGGPVRKTAYDGGGRATATYETDGGADAAYADAFTATGDTVLSQTEYGYDGNGNTLSVTTRERFHDTTGTGGLGSPSSGIGARVSYAASYYDAGDRPVAVADVGTNGGTAWTRPATVPARSETVLVTSTEYDAAGRAGGVTDPAGRARRSEYDAVGRVTKTVENYTGADPTAAADKSTTFTHGPAGMTSLTAALVGGGGQTTAWVYGVTTAGGSGVNSNDVAVTTRWPDPATGAASAAEQDTVTINALGQAVTSTDRNGTTHTLAYDVLGRVAADAVTTLGAGVDGAVRQVETAYDALGNVALVTSYDAAAGGTMVNQVSRSYNGLGQLTGEAQAHGGAATGTTPTVGYGYTEMAGGGNHSRPIGMMYPSGFELTAGYAAGLNDTIGRLTSLSDAGGTVESYDYVGLGSLVRRGHPQPGVDLTYVRQTGEPAGDAGDPYTGTDRFGRVVDHRWVKTADGTAVSRNGYGYDRFGNRTYRDDRVNTASGEVYGYDGLNQLTGFQRGTLNGAKTGVTGIPARSQGWNYDAVGNWASVTTAGVAERRTHDRQNEITGIRGGVSTGMPVSLPAPLGGATMARMPGFDAAGNMTGDEAGKTLVYDAWNRLVAVKTASSVTLETFSYDGLNRRVTNTVGSTTTALYYSAQWQVLEEQVASDTTARYVWSPVYVDTLVLRDRATGTPGTLDERLWAIQDANFNVVALVDGVGAVVERYAYDPFGAVTMLTPGYGSRSGSSYGWTQGFQGMFYDDMAKLSHQRARWYSPTLGRWASLDPIRFSAGDVNLYGFVGENPVNRVDPSGLQPPPRPFSDGVDRMERRSRDHFMGQARRYAEGRVADPMVGLEAEFTTWYNRTNDVKWTEALPDCPCSIVITQYHCDNNGFTTTSGPLNVWTTSRISNPDPAKWEDPKAWQLEVFRTVWKDFHPGATYDMRSKKTYNGHAQQCTYDAKGSLITHGPGAGTPDWSPAGSSEHIGEDVDPFLQALELDGGKPGQWVDKYLERRPPNPGKGCTKNP